MKFIGLLFSLSLLAACASLKRVPQSLDPEVLKINALTKNTFVHVSYLNTQQFGKVGCNGLVYVWGDEAIVFDTPADSATSELLIRWVEKSLKKKITAVVANHFHKDCLGGLGAFHAHGIPSYANHLTIELTKGTGETLPQHGFDRLLILKIGDRTVENRFFGEAHTRDNIVSYLPDERVLFGGCLFKAVDASKGYVDDANLVEWSATVEKIKRAYPDLKYAIPGHGDPGGMELLDFTIQLFRI